MLYAVERAVRDGASVIDLGPQSTRPGYTEISAEDEIERFAKPLELVKRNFEVPVSVDTYFEKSAKVALELGADTNCIKKRKNNAMKTVDLFAEN